MNFIYSNQNDKSIHFQFPLDPHILAEFKPWKKIIDEKGQRTVGYTKVPLKQQGCSESECNLGNFIADAFKHYYMKSLLGEGMPLKDSIIGIINAGGLRTSINAGG